jgi:peptidoglycan hydrolase-like protein with peptidoglycan-binding domain
LTNRPKFVAAALMALVLLTIPMTVFAARPTGLPTGETPPGKPDDLVLRAQKALAKAGFYRGPQDGRMSRAIRAAVRAYQTQARLKVTGRISKALVDGLENNLQVRILLKRLDQVRIENMGAAREALLNHPATRDLVTGTEEEVADPTREKAACLESITVRCLLTESLESAKAVFKPELRDWALGEILVAQARAGLGPEAMDTAGKIATPG